MHPFRPIPTEVRSSTLIPGGVRVRGITCNTNMAHKLGLGIKGAPVVFTGSQFNNKTESNDGDEVQGSGLKVTGSIKGMLPQIAQQKGVEDQRLG